MPHKTSSKCKICTCKFRVEIEQSRVRDKKTFDELALELRTKYGFHITSGAIHRHFKNHYDFASDGMELVRTESRLMYKENLVDATNRAGKLSGLIHASYEYVSTHFNELDMKTALQMMFGAIDQLNKMEGTGAFAGESFVMQIQELLYKVKQGTVVQAPLVFKSDDQGACEPITIQDPAPQGEHSEPVERSVAGS